MRRMTLDDRGYGNGGEDGTGGMHIIFSPRYGAGDFNALGNGDGGGGHYYTGDGVDHGFEDGNGEGEGYA